MELIIGMKLILMTSSLLNKVTGDKTRVCPGNTLSLQCNRGELLYITYATYGNSDAKFRCSSNKVLRDRVTPLCSSRRNVLFLKNVCNGKRSCTVNITRALFGRICQFEEDEYLDVKYQCTVGQYGIFKPLPKQPELFGRPGFPDHSKQYIGDIKFNLSKFLLFPLYFHIGEIDQLPDFHIDDEIVMRDSLHNLLQGGDIEIPPGECFPSTDPNSVQYFCSFTFAGYLMMTSEAPKASLHTIQRYQLALVMKDSRPSSTPYHGTVIVNIVTSCYPVDYLYRKMKKLCNVGSNYYIMEVNERLKLPSTFLEVYVSGAVTLSKLSIATYFTTPLHYANYTLGIQLEDSLFMQDFAYGLHIDGKKHNGYYYPHVYGDKFDIPFLEEISIRHSQYIRIYIWNHLTGDYITFSDTRAMTLFAVDTLRSCPGNDCMDAFEKWKKVYEDLTVFGKVKCIRDHYMVYTSLTFCSDSLFIDHERTHYFGMKIKLYCKGITSAFNDDDILWYKDSLQVHGEDDATLVLSGNDFSQEGYYECQSRDRTGVIIRSPKVLIHFQDVLKTLLLWELSAKEYKAVILHYSYEGFQEQLKKKILKEILKTEVVIHSEVSIEVSDNSDVHWVSVKATVYSQLKRTSSSPQFYNALPKDILALESMGVQYASADMLDRDKCLLMVTGVSSSYGKFSWNYTSVREVNVIPCPYGNKTASRLCTGNFSTLASWSEPDINQCEFGSETTKKLDSLLNDINSTSSAEEVSGKVKNLTSIPSAITSDDIALVSEIVQKISNSSTAIDIQVAKDVVDIASNMLQVNKSSIRKAQKNSLTRIIKSIDDIAVSLSQNDNETKELSEVTSGYLGIALWKKAGRYEGGVMTVKTANGSLETEPFAYRNLSDFSTTHGNSSLRINLPQTLFEDAHISELKRSIQFVYYANDALFPAVHSISKSRYIESRSRSLGGVFSVKLGSRKSVNLTEPLLFSFQIPRHENRSLQCVYWDFNANGNIGGWSSSGCHQVSWEWNQLTCSCNHLTNFAVLFTPESSSKFPLDEKNELALSIISYVGCSLSLAGILFTLVTLFLFRFLRRNTPSKILIGLCSSLAMILILFLFLIKQVEPKWMCTTTAALLQFFILSTFSWMFVEAVTLYLKIVKVMGEYTSHFMLKASCLAVGIPTIIVIICLSARLEDFGHKDLCVIRGRVLYYGLFLPTCLTMLFNIGIFFSVINALRRSRTGTINKHGEATSPAVQFRIAASCATLLGLSWIFGVLAIANARLVFQYLFCIFNSLQGLFIFYFNVFRQHRVRSAWINFLAGRGRSLDYTSSSTFHFRSKTRSTGSRPSSTAASIKENFDGDADKGAVSPLKKYSPLENTADRTSDFTARASIISTGDDDSNKR